MLDIFAAFPAFGGVLMMVVAFIVALSVIVAVHEYGHYIVARWSGIRADVFSVGFGPVLWSRHDRFGTRWQVAALPFGGFVRFRGDSDAASSGPSEATAALSPEELRQTMHGAPLWARAATVAAGPLFNFALSLVVFAGLALSTGIPKQPLSIATLHPLPGGSLEMRTGDVMVAVEGIAFDDEDFSKRLDALPAAGHRQYTVLRDGREMTVTGPALRPPRVGGINPTGAAIETDLREGDVILSVDGVEMTVFGDLIAPVNAAEGRPITLRVWREGDVFDLALSPVRRDLPKAGGGFETRWLIGVNSGFFFAPELETPGVFGAVGLGAGRIADLVVLTFSSLYHMVTGAISSCGVSGPIGIAQMSGTAASQGTVSFLMFIGLLSTAVGLLNLFPVPVLDGGHLVFFAYEAVTGRPPGDRALRVLMGIGVTLLVALMVFAVTNDLFCP